MSEFYRLVDGRLDRVTGLVSTGSVMKNAQFLTRDEAAAIGAYPFAKNPPAEKPGYRPVENGYALKNNEWMTVYKYAEVVYTVEDYNAALEEHLRKERVDRGYDTREPSQYINSTVERWRQDAEDWIRHVDQVMLYGLDIVNRYKAGDQVPTLGEFTESLPRIEWTAT